MSKTETTSKATSQAEAASRPEAASALGSKPSAATSALIFPAGCFLLVLTFLPFVYVIPYYVNMILQVSQDRAHAHLKKEEILKESLVQN
jgi:hypothetical protein